MQITVETLKAMAGDMALELRLKDAAIAQLEAELKELRDKNSDEPVKE
jgi:hypothetical protein